MTDRPHDPWAPQDGDAASPPPPPPPPDPPVIDGVVAEGPAAIDATEVRTGGIGARIVAIGVGAALLVGGLAFAATQVGGDGGSGSAEGAVAALFDALADEDVLGVLAALDEGERDTLTDPTQDLFAELERLEVVSDFELTGVPGVDLEFEGVTYRTEPIIDGLARVYVTGGTASYAIEGSELPVGDFLADTLERFGVDHTELSEQDEDSVTSEDDDSFLVARETADGWRVSIGYTAAEVARVGMGKPVPATGMQAIGSASPEEAVEGLLQAAADLDLRGVVARLSPDEFRALHHYWPVLVDEASIPTAADLGASIELADLELDADTDGDRAQVFIRSIGADVTAEDFSGGATVADGCIELRGDALDAVREEIELDDATICQEDLQEIFEESMGDLDGFGFEGFEDLMVPDPDQEQPALGITTTKVDGQWYVAPIRTMADLGVATLRVVDREDLEAAVDAIEAFFGEGFFGGGMVGGGFMPPGMADDLEDLEGLEGLDGSLQEQFSDIGESIEPGTGTTIDARTSALVEELVAMVSGDAQVAACVLDELKATATPEQMRELADAYELDFEPSPQTQDVFFTALSACGA